MKVRSYIESTINACGRIYCIQVTDERDNNMHVVEKTAAGYSAPLASYSSRSDAIEDAARRAVQWVRNY